jgi:hypothetical protein
MIKLARKQTKNALIRVTKKYHNLLLKADFDGIYETLITPESADLLAATAWPLVFFKRQKLDFLIDSTLNPNPDAPIHDVLSLAFQMDEEGCRSGLFQGIAEATRQSQWHKFNEKEVVAFVDRNAAILAADTPAKPLFMLFVKQQNGKYLVDFQSLWLFSMEMRASLLCEIASRAVELNNIPLALEYYRFGFGLKKAYSRITRLMCQHTVIGQFITDARKHQISEEIKYTALAKERFQILKTSDEKLNQITLDVKQYEKILQMLSNMASVMERSPEVFCELQEEHLRDHFLVHINGLFGAQATGETFNRGGKTDILMRRSDENIFIAECKFWGGPQKFLETVDQLLGYVTWRDTRLAILIFNRETNLSTILKKISGLMESHSSFLREVVYEPETGFRFLIKHPDDTNRELVMTILVFEIPKPA